jgi:hypothetical protein
MDRDVFVSVFDSLIIANLYKPPTVIDAVQAAPIELSENARFELMGLQNMSKPPPAVALEDTDRGFVCAVDLRQDTHLYASPRAGLKEFNYDDSAFFQIADTRLVWSRTRSCTG